ncbi:MAG: putative metal-binding motif-containing protein [Desulfobulbaceae bacterium]|nr:putative metal-binding motif-containing protein [Desulfobulbaceae bacterium]
MKQKMNAKAAVIPAAVFFLFTMLFMAAGPGHAFNSIGNAVNTYCEPTGIQPYTGDCNLCHANADNFAAAESGDYAVFCPDEPGCTDNDGDTYAIEGGDCGPVDCDDTDAAINPGAVENCNDGFDNNCNGLIDDQDPAAVGCEVCTDSDLDGYAVEGGNCGPVDCDDSDAGINPGAADIPNNGIDENCDGADSVDTSILDNDGDGFTPAEGDCDDTDGDIYPGAVEICTDGIDNDCNGLIDTQDPNAVDCPQTCIDNDGDSFAVDGGECGPVDCDDNDAATNPGAEEICGDGLDNDCDGLIDEGCDVTCPDADNDGYQDAACGGTDCNDNDAAINPGAMEIPGNGIDENCNGNSDDVVLTCPDGTLLVIKKVKFNSRNGKLKVQGRATVGTTIAIINADTGETLAEGIEVKGGKWKAMIRNVEGPLENISAITSNGCAVDEEVGTKDRKHQKEDDDYGNDDVDMHEE